jgi:uncharacterized protein (DUF433 family)
VQRSSIPFATILCDARQGEGFGLPRSFTSKPCITFNPEIMGGKPCIRGMRVTVGTIVGLVAAGRSTQEILTAYPYLEEEDVRQALRYAAWRVEELELPLSQE